MARTITHHPTVGFMLAASFCLLAQCNEEQRTMGDQRSGYSATRQILLPADGLLPTENMAAECLKEVQAVIASDFDVVSIHRAAKSALTNLWGDLSSTSIDVEFAFLGDKDRDDIRRVVVSTPHHSASFEYARDGILKICSVTLPEGGSNEPIKLGMEFFPSGKLKSLAYANQKGELIRRIAEWKEDGSLLRSESSDVPRKLTLEWNGPPNGR